MVNWIAYRRMEIAEMSMTPSLEPGDWVIARRFSSPSIPRGAVVVFTHPHRSGFDLVKRVVGLPGESLVVADHTVTADGESCDVWGHGGNGPPAAVTIPSDAVYLLGDARSRSSADSRTLGPVPLDAVHWEVKYRYWPRHRIGKV